MGFFLCEYGDRDRLLGDGDRLECRYGDGDLFLLRYGDNERRRCGEGDLEYEEEIERRRCSCLLFLEFRPSSSSRPLLSLRR